MTNLLLMLLKHGAILLLFIKAYTNSFLYRATLKVCLCSNYVLLLKSKRQQKAKAKLGYVIWLFFSVLMSSTTNRTKVFYFDKLQLYKLSLHANQLTPLIHRHNFITKCVILFNKIADKVITAIDVLSLQRLRVLFLYNKETTTVDLSTQKHSTFDSLSNIYPYKQRQQLIWLCLRCINKHVNTNTNTNTNINMTVSNNNVSSTRGSNRVYANTNAAFTRERLKEGNRILSNILPQLFFITPSNALKYTPQSYKHKQIHTLSRTRTVSVVLNQEVVVSQEHTDSVYSRQKKSKPEYIHRCFYAPQCVSYFHKKANIQVGSHIDSITCMRDLNISQKYCLQKLINICMVHGKKSKARFIITNTLYKLADLTQPQFENIDVIAFVTTAIDNVKPILEVRKVRISGSTQLVPSIISKRRQDTLAIRWILEAATKRRSAKHNLTLDQCVFAEIVDAFNKIGVVRKKRDELHKLAEANRGFSHYRWW